MPPDVLLLFQSILKGESLRKIAESRSQSKAETRAAIAEAVADDGKISDEELAKINAQTDALIDRYVKE